MTMGILENLISQDFGYRHEGSIWGRSIKHSSLVVNESSQTWYWNSIGRSGNVIDYLMLVRGMSREDAEAFLNRMAYNEGHCTHGTASSPHDKLVDLFWSIGKNNRDYWYRRCLTNQTIDRFRLGFYDGWYTIPIYTNSQFLNFQLRRDVPDKRISQWYRHSPQVIYNADILKFVFEVFMTEGTVDAILLAQFGLPAVSTNGARWIQDWTPLFDRITTVYYIADNDDPGIRSAIALSKWLGVYRVKIAILGDREKYDTVDFFRDGRTIDEFKDICYNRFKFSFELGKGTNEYRTRY